jgi:hypothetical protein
MTLSRVGACNKSGERYSWGLRSWFSDLWCVLLHSLWFLWSDGWRQKFVGVMSLSLLKPGSGQVRIARCNNRQLAFCMYGFHVILSLRLSQVVSSLCWPVRCTRCWPEGQCTGREGGEAIIRKASCFPVALASCTNGDYFRERYDHLMSAV